MKKKKKKKKEYKKNIKRNCLIGSAQIVAEKGMKFLNEKKKKEENNR